MANYNLNHLTQSEKQDVIGPIQDDEALLLYAIIRVMRLKNIVELGGLGGYSALNFSKAVGDAGKVISVDINKTPKVAENHHVVVGNCSSTTPAMLKIKHIDLLFFDTHDFDASMIFFRNMSGHGLIDSKTILALHDTGTHPKKFVPWAYSTKQGYVHQPVERKIVNKLVRMGYHALCCHTDPSVHNDNFPYRHGITILSKFKQLAV